MKRTDVLVSAWAKVVEAFPTARLIIFGDGPLLDKCKTIATESGIEDNIDFRGRAPQKEIWKEMGKGWITVLPSRREGFPMPLIECLACGCPFISTPCGAAPEIAQKTGGGIIVNEPLISEKLAEVIIGSFSNKDRLIEMGKEGRVEAKDLYSWEKIAKNKIETYEKALTKIGKL